MAHIESHIASLIKALILCSTSLICWREDEDFIQVDKAKVVQHVPENIVEGALEKCVGALVRT